MRTQLINVLLVASLGTLCVAGCSSVASNRVLEDGSISKRQAVAIAYAELARRKLRTPPAARVEIEESVSDVEFGASRRTYIVRFRVGPRSPRSAIYSMSVDRETGAVDGFVDIRTTIPIR